MYSHISVSLKAKINITTDTCVFIAITSGPVVPTLKDYKHSHSFFHSPKCRHFRTLPKGRALAREPVVCFPSIRCHLSSRDTISRPLRRNQAYTIGRSILNRITCTVWTRGCETGQQRRCTR